MGNSLAKVISFGAKAYASGRNNLLKQLGNEAVSHFKDNFRKQGFDDNTVQPWKQRKNDSDPGRAINVKTGRLRRSFDVLIPSLNRAIVENTAPYGVYHNYGTNSTIAAGSRESFFKTKVKGEGFLKMGKNGKYKMSYKSKTIDVRGADVGYKSHTRVLPQRKFMGRSRNLDEKSGVIIMRMMKRALR